MKNIDELLENMRWDKPDVIRDNALRELLSISDSQIPELIRYKDEEAAKVLLRLGYPRVQNVLGQLLEWLQDINWPGAQEIAELLVSVGKPVVPFVKEVLSGNDQVWKYWVLEFLVNRWPVELVNELKDEIVFLARTTDLFEEVDILAMKVLCMKKLFPLERLICLHDGKNGALKSYQMSLDDLGRLLKDH